MQQNSGLRRRTGYVTASGLVCPFCQGALLREPRRIVDRLHSLVRPVKRYRCEKFGCQWVGNLPASQADAQVRGEGDVSSHPVPAAFVVHMVLAAAGVVFVLVFSAMEPSLRVDEDATVSEAARQVPQPEWSANRADAR